KFIEDSKADFVIDVDVDGNYIYDEEALKAFKDKHDPAGFQAHLNDKNVEPNSGGTWFTKIPKNIPLNPNYEKLTRAQKEYHRWFGQKYMDAYVDRIFDYRIGQTDIDLKLMDFSATLTEGLANKAKYLGKAGIDFLKNSFTVTSRS